MITKDSKTLINQFDIVQVISSYIKLSKKGDNYWGICPFHQDTKPSLSVSSSKQIYKCFACENSGNAITFVMKYKQISFFDAILEIKNNLNLEIDLSNFKTEFKIDESKNRLFALNDLVSNWYQAFLQNAENINALKYLKNRKLTDEIIKKFRIGFAPNRQKQIFDLATNQNNIRQLIDDKNVYTMNELLETNLIFISQDGKVFDTFSNRIVFPIIDLYNNITGFSARIWDNSSPDSIKYLNTKTTDIFKKNETFYNINNFDFSKDYVYIVEGFFDVISLDIIGIKNVLCTMGVAFSDTHKQILKETLKVNKVILAYDNDAAGKSATIKTASILSNNFDIFIVDYETELKDFNDLLVNDEEQLKKQINNLKDFCLFYLQNFVESKTENEILFLNEKYLECLKIIKKFGKKVYFENYFSFLKNNFNIPEDIVLKDIKTNLMFNKYDNLSNKNNNFNNSKELSLKENSINFFNYKIQILKKQINNIYDKLIQFCLFSVDFFNYIYDKYTFDKTNINIYNCINVILDFYEKFSINSITLNSKEFYKFCIQNQFENEYNYLKKIISYQIINNVDYKLESINILLNKLKVSEYDLKINEISIYIKKNNDLTESEKQELYKKQEILRNEIKKIN